MQSGTINDITNLCFFTDRGYQLPMQKDFTLTWELVSGQSVKRYVKEASKGYFISDVESDLKLKSNTLVAGVNVPGKVFVRMAEQAGHDENGK